MIHERTYILIKQFFYLFLLSSHPPSTLLRQSSKQYRSNVEQVSKKSIICLLTILNDKHLKQLMQQNFLLHRLLFLYPFVTPLPVSAPMYFDCL